MNYIRTFMCILSCLCIVSNRCTPLHFFTYRYTWGNPTNAVSVTSPLPSLESSKFTSTKPMPSQRTVAVPTASRCSQRLSSRNTDTLPSSTATSARSVASHSLNLATYTCQVHVHKTMYTCTKENLFMFHHV